MNFKLSLSAILLAVSSGSVFAVDKADLSVTGKIVPASCDVAYANGGLVEFGDIEHTALNKDKTSTLPGKGLTWSITCNAPIPVAMKWTDNKRADGVHDSDRMFHFGIGKDSKDQPIGRLYMTMGGLDAITVTGGATGDSTASVIRSVDGGANWNISATSEPYHGGWTSFAPTGATTPAAYQTYNGGLTFTTTIAPTDLLDITGSLAFEGSVTMDLEYL